MSKRDAMEKVREASYFSSRQRDGGIKEPPLKDLDLQRICDREKPFKEELADETRAYRFDRVPKSAAFAVSAKS